MTIDLPYSATEAAARLAPLVARSTKSAPIKGYPLRGEVSARGFRLAAVTSYQSSFAAWSEGTFTPTPGGCRLRYRTGTSAWSFLLLLFWFGMLLAIGYHRLDPRYVWSELLTRNPDAGQLWLMLGGGVLIAGFGYALAWREAQTIEETLRRALEPEASVPSTPDPERSAPA